MSIFNFELLKVPFASGAVLSEIEPFPDYVRGLGIAFEQTDGKPEMKGLNGLFNAITTSMLSLRQRGISEWVTDFDYPVGGFAVESGKLYQAKTLNKSKQPSISQSDWTLWASVSDITVHANGNIKKENSANGAFELKVEDASTTTKGATRFATATEVANKDNVMAAVTPKNIKDMFVGGSSADDYMILPNGMIIQWGIATEHISKSFKIPFPNACFGVQVTPILSGDNSSGAVTGVSINGKESFTCYVGSNSGDKAYYFAIGY